MTIRDKVVIPVKDNFGQNMPQLTGFQAFYVGRGKVRYIYNGSSNYIGQTGSAVLTTFYIPTLHRLYMVRMLVTNSSNAADNTNNILQINHQIYVSTVYEQWWTNSNTAASSFQALFDKPYDLDLATYQISSNCPNTDRLYLVIEVFYPDWRDYETQTATIQPTA
jgi:hypothetical protein